MKWIGQNVWSFISRFRSDVYLEDVGSGTIASGGNLGLDSNNKIVKANAGHVDTSSQASINGSGRTYIQDVTLDTFGHVTGLATATETVVDTSIRVFGLSIKILPSDFMADDAGDNGSVNFAETDRLGVMASNTNQNIYAFMDIPKGYTAEAVTIFGSHTGNYHVYQLNVNGALSSLPTSLGNGNVGTEINITDVVSSSTNYLAIKVIAGALENRIYGGLITISQN